MFSGQHFLEHFPLDAVAPESVGVGFVLRPGGFLPVDLHGAIAGEIHFLLQDRFHLAHAVFHPLPVEIENLESRLGIAEQDVVVEGGAVAADEEIDVLLGEEKPVVVQPLEVVFQEQPRDAVIELLLGIVPLHEELTHGNLDLPGIGLIRGDPHHGENEEGGQRQPEETQRLHYEMYPMEGQRERS